MVVEFRSTSPPSHAISSPKSPSSPPVALLSSPEKVGAPAPQKRKNGECSISFPTTIWLAPDYSTSTCTIVQTVLPCGSVVIASACPGETVFTTVFVNDASPTPIAAPAAQNQQTEGPPHDPGEISQGELNGIIIGVVLAVIVLVVAIFLYSNRRLIRGDIFRGTRDDESIDLEEAPRRPNGGGGAAPPEAPAEPQAPPAAEPAAAPAPEPAAEPAAAAAPEAAPAPDPLAAPPAAPPPAGLDLALLPPAALVGNPHHESTPPHSSPSQSSEPSDDGEYVYRRRRRRRSSSESRVRFVEEPEIIPDRRHEGNV